LKKEPQAVPVTFHRRAPVGAPLIDVTPDAARQIRTAAKDSGSERLALRIAARRDADGSIDYAMGFDNARKGDVTLTSNGVALVVAEEERELLAGMTVDFVEFEPGDFRFIFVNPNDSASVPPPADAADGAR
jgi:iron-sulfur cluster assembly protein